MQSWVRGQSKCLALPAQVWKKEGGRGVRAAMATVARVVLFVVASAGGGGDVPLACKWMGGLAVELAVVGYNGAFGFFDLAELVAVEGHENSVTKSSELVCTGPLAVEPATFVVLADSTAAVVEFTRTDIVTVTETRDGFVSDPVVVVPVQAAEDFDIDVFEVVVVADGDSIPSTHTP